MNDRYFRRNLILIAGFHVLLLLAIFFYARREIKKPMGDVVWLDPGAFAAAVPEMVPESTPEPTPQATPEPTPEATPEPTPELTREPIEDTIPLNTPTPTPTPKATPKTTPKPSPKPTPKATPKSTPKATPKATPKEGPKATPKAKAEDQGESEEKDSSASKSQKSEGTGSAKKGSGSAAKSGGVGEASNFGWYHELIHDRFYSQWDQPTSIFDHDKSFICTVQIRIEKGGEISNVKILKSSGNVVMDESVLAAGRRVMQIDPLPSGLGSGGSYTVNINFELE